MERPPEIEQSINVALAMPREELLERASINDRGHPGYLPSECLLHLLRRTKFDNDDRLFRKLFDLLRGRVLRALPRAEGRSGSQATEDRLAKDVRDEVLFRFNELLCLDRDGGDDRLDFFEVRFEQAISRLRITAKRKAFRMEAASAPLGDEESSEPSAEVEEAAALFRPPEDEILAPRYRKMLALAIDSLPTDERKVITMMLAEIPIVSEDPEKLSMVKILGCSAKTVWNRRDRAIKKLTAMLTGKGKP